MVIGGLIGARLANKVVMTEMPELVAILHSFVGVAAVLVGFNSFIAHDVFSDRIMENIHLIEIFPGIFIGAVTFTGSIVAYGKLCGKMAFKPLMLPNRHKLNLLALLISFILLFIFVKTIATGLQVFVIINNDHHCVSIWLAPSLLNWWCRYAGYGINTKLLFRMGRCCCRLYAK